MENQNNFDADLGSFREPDFVDIADPEEAEKYISLKTAKIIEYISADGRSGTVVEFQNTLDQDQEVPLSERLRLLSMAHTAVITDYVKHSVYEDFVMEELDEDDFDE